MQSGEEFLFKKGKIMVPCFNCHQKLSSARSLHLSGTLLDFGLRGLHTWVASINVKIIVERKALQCS